MTSATYELGKAYEGTSTGAIEKIKRGLCSAARTGFDFVNGAQLRFEAQMIHTQGAKALGHASLQAAADGGEMHPAIRDLLRQRGDISSSLDTDRYAA